MTKTAGQRDFLDEIVDERGERNREFPELVEAALRRRKTLHELAQRREQRRRHRRLMPPAGPAP
jgi:hypothetical protein